METWEAVRTIRVVRRFRADALPAEVVERILHAGRRTASSKNRQRWDFVTVTRPETLERLARVGPYAGHLAGAALAVALVTPGPARPGGSLSDVWDIGRAAQNMVLVAWELGVGSVPATVYEQEVARVALHYPDDRHCGWILSFGYPSDPLDLTRPPEPGGRKSLDEVVHRETW